MKITPLLQKLFILLFLAGFVLSCSRDDDDNPNDQDGDGQVDDDDDEGEEMDDDAGEEIPNIIELAESVDALSNLVAALDIVDPSLATFLSEEGSTTVFAPSNDAFTNLFEELEGFNSLEDFDEEPEIELLADILRYHIIADTTINATDLSDGQILETLQTEEITVVINEGVFIQDRTEELAALTSADNEASNGIVHIIDKILLPQAVIDQLFPRLPIPELIIETEELSLFNQALEITGLNEDLGAEGPFTVFAPSNAAVQQLFDLLGEDFANFDDFDTAVEIVVLRSLLQYHLLSGTTLSTDLQDGTVSTLLNGENLDIISSGDSFVIGDATEVDANLTSVDNEASNGVVHIVDKVLIPQFVIDFLDDDAIPPTDTFTIAELVSSSDDFSLLREALVLTGLLDTLDGEGPFTVFAPSNEAFTALLPLLGGGIDNSGSLSINDFGIDLLTSILSYHISDGELVSSDFVAGEIQTLSGDNTLNLVDLGNEFAVQDVLRLNANFLFNDISAENGVVHIIDRILIPESAFNDIATEANETLLNFLENQDLDISEAITLLSMLSASIADLINNEFTFFLPTNQAFLDFFDQIDGVDSLADFNTAEEIELLIRLLRYHCVETGRLSADQLSNMQVLPTAQGENLEIDIDGNMIFVLDQTEDSSKIINTDNNILNGVIHIVDKVLVPQEIIDALSL